MVPGGPPAFVFQNTQRAGKIIFIGTFFFRMNPQRDQRSKGKSFALLFCKANERRVVSMSKTSQAGLKRHGNISRAEIKYHQTKTAGAQQFLARPGGMLSELRRRITTSAAKSVPLSAASGG